jgi:homoserine O-acetyltransferase/O-succinyltransferase
MMGRVSWTILTVLLLLTQAGWAYDGVVDKKTFSLPAYTTVNGQTIKDVRVGWESYGTLGAPGSNRWNTPNIR